MVRHKMLAGVFLVAAMLLSTTQAGAMVPEPQDITEEPGNTGGGDPGGGSPEPDGIDWAPDIHNLGIEIVLLPQVTPLDPSVRDRGPWGVWSPNCANDFCMPDLPPLGDSYCMDPVNAPGDVMTRNGVAYGNIARSCYQLILALAFQAATGVDPNPREFTLQQFQRNIHQQCNEQFTGWQKYTCYIASGKAKDAARARAYEYYGRIAVIGFNVAPFPEPWPVFAHPFPVPYRPANQYSHGFIAACGYGGASPCSPVPQGRTFGPGGRLYLTGVVRPGSKMLYTFEDAKGRVLDWWITAEARDNGVVHHEREEFQLDRLPRGTVRVVARYQRWEDGQTTRQIIGDINLTAGGGGGSGGGIDPCDLEPEMGAIRQIAARPPDTCNGTGLN